jgi:hypothetical protein
MELLASMVAAAAGLIQTLLGHLGTVARLLAVVGVAAVGRTSLTLVLVLVAAVVPTTLRNHLLSLDLAAMDR